MVRQWPKVNDLCHTFCTLRESKNLRACWNSKQCACYSGRPWVSHAILAWPWIFWLTQRASKSDSLGHYLVVVIKATAYNFYNCPIFFPNKPATSLSESITTGYDLTMWRCTFIFLRTSACSSTEILNLKIDSHSDLKFSVIFLISIISKLLWASELPFLYLSQ